MSSVSKTITSEKTWTDSISPGLFDVYGYPKGGHLAYSVIIPDASTVTLQRSFDAGSNWHDVKSFTSSDEGSITDPTDRVLYRIGVASGDYDSGDVDVELVQ